MAESYFLLLDGKEEGPYSLAAVQALIASGRLSGALIRDQQEQVWRTLAEVGIGQSAAVVTPQTEARNAASTDTRPESKPQNVGGLDPSALAFKPRSSARSPRKTAHIVAAIILCGLSLYGWAAYKRYVAKAETARTALESTTAAEPASSVRVSGEYRLATDPETLDLLGRQLCFYPDATSKKSLHQGTAWFCFDDLNASARLLQINVQETRDNCGYEGEAVIDIGSYVPYLEESDAGNDEARLLSVVSQTKPKPISCPDQQEAFAQQAPLPDPLDSKPSQQDNESVPQPAEKQPGAGQIIVKRSAECLALERELGAADRDFTAGIGGPPRMKERAQLAVAYGATGCINEARQNSFCAIPKVANAEPEACIKNPPRYPPEEMRKGIQGTVVVVAEIDVRGVVSEVLVEQGSGNRNLDRTAVNTVKSWRFSPRISNGTPVPARHRIPVDFRLSQGTASAGD